MIDELATLQHWQVAVKQKTMHVKQIQYPCHWTKAKKKKKFPTDKVAERAGGWK